MNQLSLLLLGPKREHREDDSHVSDCLMHNISLENIIYSVS